MLEHADGAVSKNDMLLMLSAAKTSDRVSPKHSEDMCVAILKFIGEHDLATKYAGIWGCVASDMDDLMARLWSKAVVGDSGRKTWVVAYRHALSPLLPVKLALQMLSEESIETCSSSLGFVACLVEGESGGPQPSQKCFYMFVFVRISFLPNTHLEGLRVIPLL